MAYTEVLHLMVMVSRENYFGQYPNIDFEVFYTETIELKSNRST